MIMIARKTKFDYSANLNRTYGHHELHLCTNNNDSDNVWKYGIPYNEGCNKFPSHM